MLVLFSGGDAARSKLGGRLLPTSNPGMQQTVAEARPTDSSGQRAYFPLALQVLLDVKLVFYGGKGVGFGDSVDGSVMIS